MDSISAKPQTIKQLNLSAIRRVLKAKGTATKAEIAHSVHTSTTTVRSLLAEMCENGEIESIGCGESSGGRRAQRYRLNPDRYYGVAFFLAEPTIQYIIVNLYGEIVEDGSLPTPAGELEPFLLDFLSGISQNREIRSVCIGVPGIAENDGYSRKNRHDILQKTRLGEGIRSKYGIPVLLENDINAITIGAGRSHIKKLPEEFPRLHLAFIHFDTDCIGAGFLSDGKLVKGWRNFAGELGFLPAGDGRNLREKLQAQSGLQQFADAAAALVAQIGCILNPQYVILSGPCFRKEALEAIQKHLCGMLPANLIPTVLHSEDAWRDYRTGMAYLCAELIFCEIEISGHGITNLL